MIIRYLIILPVSFFYVLMQIVSELPAGTNLNFDVHWYPKIPGIISASSFDGKVGIYNIEACARYGAGENYYGQGNIDYSSSNHWHSFYIFFNLQLLTFFIYSTFKSH